MPDSLESWFAIQDDLITRQQALAYLSDAAIQWRLGRQWQVVLPGVYKADRSPLSEVQRLRAALLYAGPGSMLNDTSALRTLGLPYVPDEAEVRLLVSDSVQRASRQFVVTKRTWRLPTSIVVGGLSTAPLDRALCEFAARHDSERDSLAVVAAAVQQGRVRLGSLLEEAYAGQARGRPRLLRVLAPIEAGVRSAPEADFRALVARSRVLPTPLWNCLIELPDGTVVSPDALFEDAALIHEVNGRQFHAPDEAGEDLFEAMQRRHDLLAASGLSALHNSPRRVRRDGDCVLREMEEVYLRRAGRGMPAGIKILRTAPAA
jgi:hypothetical protein